MANTRPAYFFLLIASILNVAMLLAIAILPAQSICLRCQRYIRSARRNEARVNAADPTSGVKTSVMPGFTSATLKADRIHSSPLALLAGFFSSRGAVCQLGDLGFNHNNHASQLQLQRFRLSADHPPEYVL